MHEIVQGQFLKDSLLNFLYFHELLLINENVLAFTYYSIILRELSLYSVNLII